MTTHGVHVPQAVLGAAGGWILSAAIRALPEPQPMANQGYLWLYNFAHLLGANFDKIGK